MEKVPFILIDEYSIKNISSVSLSRFLNWIGCSARTKKEFLSKYHEYSLCCSKERWLRFVKDICEFNGFVYQEDKWSREFDNWQSKNCSYSVFFHLMWS